MPKPKAKPKPNPELQPQSKLNPRTTLTTSCYRTLALTLVRIASQDIAAKRQWKAGKCQAALKGKVNLW